jgi:CRP/FNR family transcriptional regulator, cyclic AMP receptor protein
MNKLPSSIASPSSAGSLGGALRHYRTEQIIYSQGAHADTLFYIQEGGVYLTTSAKYKSSVVTAILGAGDFFGDSCLIGFPERTSTAIALTGSSIRVLKKEPIIRMLRRKNKVSNSFVFYLLSMTKKYRDHVAELLTLSAEQRLACVLLRLAHLDRRSTPIEGVITVNQQILAEMVGTTRSRLNFFMNRFRKRGFLNYRAGRIEVYESLHKALERP